MPVLRDLIAQRDKAFADFEYVAATYRSFTPTATATEPPADWTATYIETKAAVEVLDERIGELDKEERNTAMVNAARARINAAVPVGDSVVRSEPRTYGPESPGNSFYADLAASGMPGNPRYIDAVERLARHGKEAVRDSVNDPKERGRVLRASREHFRGDESAARRFADGLERRTGMDTTSGSGGSFVTPQYFVPEYAPYRTFGRSFIDECNLLPLPEYGVTVYLPQVTAPAGVASQSTQNTGIDESDPTAGYLSATLTVEAGQVTVSQQLLDRAGPGIQFDKLVFDQLQRAYNTTIDAAILTQALANAGAVSNTETGSTAVDIITSFYSDVANAYQAIATAAGVVLAPTHIFATPIQWAFLASQVDTSGRPLIVPAAGGPFNAVAAALNGKEMIVPEGNTGYEVMSLPVFKDGNIPTTNTNADTQIIVAHMPEIWVWEGELVPRVLPQTYAANLSVLLQVYSYNAVIVRYPKAVQSITGARYPKAPTFTQA